VGGYFVSILSTFKKTKLFNKLLFISTIIILFILSGFRSMNVGYDNVSHEQFFYSIASGQINIADFKEPGYALLSAIVSILGDYHLFLIVYAAISLIVLIKVINYFSLNPYVSLYVYYAFYFLGNNMAKIRQSMAVLILLLGLKYLHKKEEKIFVILVCIAASFHASALFFLVLLLIKKIYLTKKKMLGIVLISALVGQSGLIEYIYFELIGNSQFFHGIQFLSLNRLAKYTTSHYSIREGAGYLGYIYTLLNSILVVWFYDKLKVMNDGKAIIIAKTYYWGTVLFFLLFNLAVINSRLTMAFIATEIFLIPYLFKCIKDKNLRVIFLSIYLLGVLLRGYLGFLGNFDEFVPFEFFWSS
jgi:hypothetical protein